VRWTHWHFQSTYLQNNISARPRANWSHAHYNISPGLFWAFQIFFRKVTNQQGGTSARNQYKDDLKDAGNPTHVRGLHKQIEVRLLKEAFCSAITNFRKSPWIFWIAIKYKVFHRHQIYTRLTAIKNIKFVMNEASNKPLKKHVLEQRWGDRA